MTEHWNTTTKQEFFSIFKRNLILYFFTLVKAMKVLNLKIRALFVIFLMKGVAEQCKVSFIFQMMILNQPL